MTQKSLLVLLVTMFALATFAQSVSAQENGFGTISLVEINGINAEEQGINLAQFAGETVEVLVRFDSTANAKDATISAWISGEKRDMVESERFDVFPDRTYTKIVRLRIPANLDDTQEDRTLEIEVSARDGFGDRKSISLFVERNSYRIQILSATMQPEVKAGESLMIDSVVKNRGSREADDVFLRVRIPELGIEELTFYGDLSPVDNYDERHDGYFDDEEDSQERRTFLRIPANAAPGLYTVELEAFNDDSFAQMQKRVLVVSTGREASVFSSNTADTFSTGESGKYTITLVNRGNSISVFNLVANAPSNLNVDLSESVVVIPAGLSKTVDVFANSNLEDSYQFSVTITSEDGQVIGQESFTANVEGKGTSGSSAGNTTVLLTVVLAIVFIVLLVVLIVLLTRKPETKEEFGESYY